MSAPDELTVGRAVTLQGRIAAVAHAKRTGVTPAECIEDVDAVLDALPLPGLEREARRTSWNTAMVAVYGRRAVQLAMLHREEQHGT